MKFPLLLPLSPIALLFSYSAAHAAFSLGGPSVGAGWIAVGVNYDFIADQQTGDPASDIVGTAANPGFYTAFDNGGTPSLTDGALAFRVRLDDRGGNNNTIRFDRNLWVGIDADLNGSVDAFLGVSTPSQNVILGIYDAGSGNNTSPNTTTIGSLTTTYTYSAVSTNYNYRPVNSVSDGGSLNDLTPGGTDTDYYVSFQLSFAAIATFLTAQLPGVFTVASPLTENTPLRYVVGTSTQSNTLNQDLGGIDNSGAADLNQTWTALGGFTPIISATGQLASVPECSATLLAIVASALGFSFNRRRR
jgi:hypothetical protein